MTSLHLERNLLKEHFRERRAHANTNNMIDEKGSRQGDCKDSLSGTQGSAEAKTLTCVTAPIHTSIRFFFRCPWQSVKGSQRKVQNWMCIRYKRHWEGRERKAQCPRHWALHNPLTSFQDSSSNRHLQKSKEKETIMWQMPYLVNSLLISKQLVPQETKQWA